MQIWLQAMFHLWRERGSEVLVLDEPDVFLHPDLQRRLARALFALPGQKILATHSVEVLAEAPPASAVWVDRTRRNAERPRRDGALGVLGRRLGSGLELGVARALRSRVALFVEGQDMRLLSLMAEAVGAVRLGRGADLTVVPLGGFDRRQLAGAFAEVLQVLGSDVRVHVLLDRDLRDDATVAAAKSELQASGARAHVWQRKEIESYLLAPEALAACAGITPPEAEALIDEHILAQADATRVFLIGRRLETKGGLNDRTVIAQAEREFSTLWADPAERLRIVAPKDVLTAVNRTLQQRGLPAASTRALASHLGPACLPDEVRDLLLSVEAELA